MLIYYHIIHVGVHKHTKVYTICVVSSEFYPVDV